MTDFDTRLQQLAHDEKTPLPEGFEDWMQGALERLPRKRRPLRAALLAACLCLMLAGTVLAVESGVLARWLSPEEAPGVQLDYDITGGWQVTTQRRVAAADFSPAVQQVRGTEQRCFGTWQEAADYLGYAFPRSGLMESSGTMGAAIGGADGRSQLQGSYITRVLGEESGVTDVAILSGCVLEDTYSVTADVLMYTENATEPTTPLTVLLAEGSTTVSVEQLADYTTVSGETIPVLRLLAHPVEVDADGGETLSGDTVWTYFTVVPVGSCMVQLILSPMGAEPDPAACLETLYRLAESFA